MSSWDVTGVLQTREAFQNDAVVCPNTLMTTINIFQEVRTVAPGTEESGPAAEVLPSWELPGTSTLLCFPVTLSICQTGGWASETLGTISKIQWHGLFLFTSVPSPQPSSEERVLTFSERVKAKRCSPATHSKSSRADHCSQALLLCSLSFPAYASWTLETQELAPSPKSSLPR